jgi:protein-tyrosine phosphatase
MYKKSHNLTEEDYSLNVEDLTTDEVEFDLWDYVSPKDIDESTDDSKDSNSSEEFDSNKKQFDSHEEFNSWYRELLEEKESFKKSKEGSMSNNNVTVTHHGYGEQGHSVQHGFAMQTQSSKPAIAYSIENVEFLGTAKHYLDDITIYPTDLIINLTGIKYIPKPPKPFIKEVPLWLDIKPELDNLITVPPHQLLLDWTDFGAPPDRIGIDFWEKILDGIDAQGIKRVICCCVGGYGRTGTALAAFLLASNVISEPEDAIKFIKENYREKAIESKSQELYLWNLVYTEEEILNEKKSDEPIKAGNLLPDSGYVETKKKIK